MSATPQNGNALPFWFMRLPEVVHATGRSGTTLWRLEKSGEFPRRRRIGGNAVAWRSDEVLAWLESRPTVEGQ